MSALITSTIEKRLLCDFLNVLQQLPGVQKEVKSIEVPRDSGRKSDLLVDLHVGRKSATLFVEVKKSVYPRDVRQLLWRLKEFPRNWSLPNISERSAFVLLAQSISPGAKELLRNELVGYYDSGGSLFLAAKSIYIYVDKPPPISLAKSIRSIFSGRRAQVLHVILNSHRDWFGVNEISSQARVSAATASQVLIELEKFDWVVSSGNGPSKKRYLQEPGALLDEWTNQMKAMRPLTMSRYFVPSQPTEGLVERISRVLSVNKVEYAITHEAAGQQYAPFLSTISQVRCRMTRDRAAEEALRSLDARLVDHGANFTVIEVTSPDELLFRELVNDIWWASPIQVYFDLMFSEGRSKEFATHLRRERIGF